MMYEIAEVSNWRMETGIKLKKSFHNEKGKEHVKYEKRENRGSYGSKLIERNSQIGIHFLF